MKRDFVTNLLPVCVTNKDEHCCSVIEKCRKSLPFYIEKCNSHAVLLTLTNVFVSECVEATLNQKNYKVLEKSVRFFRFDLVYLNR